MEELCEDSTLKNVVIMIQQWSKVTKTAEAQLQSDLFSPYGFVQAVVGRGAKICRCTGAFDPDLAALRIILEGRSVIPEVQQEPINKDSESERTAVRPVEPSMEKLESRERRNSGIRELGGSTQEAVDKEVKQLRQELEEQKKEFKKLIAEIQSKEESTRREVEEQKRKALEEADGFKKFIAKMQSKLEEDRHASGKAFATYNFPPVPARSRVLLVGSLTHLASQRVYLLTDLHPNSPIGLMTHFTARSMNNGCKTFRRMTSSGLLTIWTRHVTMSPFPTGRSSWPVGSRQSRSFGTRFPKVFARTRKYMRDSHHTSNILYNSFPPSYRRFLCVRLRWLR